MQCECEGPEPGSGVGSFCGEHASSRCTRAATVEARQLQDTRGRPALGSWYHLCGPCSDAIVGGGGHVEIRALVVM